MSRRIEMRGSAFSRAGRWAGTAATNTCASGASPAVRASSVGGQPVFADALEIEPTATDAAALGILESHRYVASGFWYGVPTAHRWPRHRHAPCWHSIDARLATTCSCVRSRPMATRWRPRCNQRSMSSTGVGLRANSVETVHSLAPWLLAPPAPRLTPIAWAPARSFRPPRQYAPAANSQQPTSYFASAKSYPASRPIQMFR